MNSVSVNFHEHHINDMNVEMSGESSLFLVMVSGQVDTGHFPLYDDLYCRVTVVYGSDWLIVAGTLLSSNCSRYSPL